MHASKYSVLIVRFSSPISSSLYGFLTSTMVYGKNLALPLSSSLCWAGEWWLRLLVVCFLEQWTKSISSDSWFGVACMHWNEKHLPSWLEKHPKKAGPMWEALSVLSIPPGKARVNRKLKFISFTICMLLLVSCLINLPHDKQIWRSSQVNSYLICAFWKHL